MERPTLDARTDKARPGFSGELFGQAPALLPAAALLVGLTLGLARPATPIGLPVVLALLGLSLGVKDRRRAAGPAQRGDEWVRRGARVLVAAVVGLLAGALAGREPLVPDPGRPVSAMARVAGHWRHDQGSWSAPVRIVRMRQGLRVESLARDATLRLPGDAPPPPLGTCLRVKGFLRRAAGLGDVPPLDPGPWRLSTKSRRLVSLETRAGVLGLLATRLRRRVERALDARDGELSGEGRRATDRPPGRSPTPSLTRSLARPLARALVLGDSSEVPLRVRQGLRRLGLAHVLAVSGLHVGLVAGALLLLGTGLPRTARLAVALAGVALYLLLAGPRPSLLRASVMAGLAATALLAERPPQAANALAVAAAGLGLADPRVVLDAGFRLTVAATAGIVLLGPLLDRSWKGRWWGAGERAGGKQRAAGDRPARRWADGARRTIAASVGAQLGVMPWALPLFCLVTPWAPLANLVLVPWTGLALGLCLVWVALGSTVPAAAQAALPLLEAVAAPFAWPAAVPPRPWIALPVSIGCFGAAVLAALLLVVLADLGRSRRGGRAGRLISGALVAVALSGAARDAGGGARGGVSAVMIDVGQGDAILLRDGPHAALVDGGGWRYGDLGGRVLLPVLAHLGVRRLEAVIASHGDRDHCGGLVDIAGYLAVGRAISGPDLAAGRGASRCGRELAGLPAVARRIVARGAVLRVGRWRLRVLHPEPPAGPDLRPGGARARHPASDNDGSLVLQAEAFGRRLLLTGDIEARAERELVRSVPEALRCDLLKVAHHGSKTSSRPSFLDAASPRIAVVSAGVRNPYGHPAQEVLARFAERRVRVVRTDRDGMVIVRISPEGRMTLDLPGAPKPVETPGLHSGR